MAGAVCGIFSGASFDAVVWTLPALCALSVVGWRRRASFLTVAILAAAFGVAGFALASAARETALHASLRIRLDEAFGGFAIEQIGPHGDHDPLATRAVLVEDASPREDFVTIRARVTAVAIGGAWQPAEGGVSLTVSGAASADRFPAWRGGRTIEAPMTFRRPARYLNDGVPDFERDLALSGTTLFASVKSGLLIDVVANGSRLQEAAADLRTHVRRAVHRWVTPHDAVAGAIVTAVLIGDRTGLPDDIRDRLQAAGTYHVIAISGGNIAILAALVIGSLMLVGVRGRLAATVTIVVLVGYSQVATAGPSVWRATLMAVVYLAARLLDHRTAPWQATMVAAALMVVVQPLDLRDPGFVLTFGATAALLEGARRGGARFTRNRLASWLLASCVASLAVEIALLPVAAQMFSRITTAGLVLNLIAVPAMGMAQVAGLAVVLFDGPVASAAGWLAYAGSSLLVESARLVDEAPWLAARVPAPGIELVLTYYGSLAVMLLTARRAVRASGGVAFVLSAACLCGGFNPVDRGAAWLAASASPAPVLRWTTFDVGQGEAMLVEPPAGEPLLIDTGGAPFGSGSFDIGERVLAPALWTRGIRALGALLVTHGDPDHLGGAPAVLEGFAPPLLWEGIRVPAHAPMRELRDAAVGAGVSIAARRVGESLDWGGARIRVLHPPEPDWERPRVRNDDSVVIEVLYRDVALLLTGDISAEVERALVPLLTPARTRILKVGHHGSRTSTSSELLDAWRPQIAVISCGRGNSFGHPTPDVLRRLRSIGTTVYRTDRDGQITLETDGREVRVRTFAGIRDPGPGIGK